MRMQMERPQGAEAMGSDAQEPHDQLILEDDILSPESVGVTWDGNGVGFRECVYSDGGAIGLLHLALFYHTSGTSGTNVAPFSQFL